MHSTSPPSKNLRIDTLRGLACIFLVFFHIIGNGADSGLKIQGGLLRDFNDLLAYIRMPLFTFLSGYVYALRPFKSQSATFIKGKARRLLLPMLVAGTFFAIIKSLTPGSNSEVDNWLTLHIIPVAHFWFVEALFLIFLAIVVLEKFKLFATRNSAVVVALVAVVLFLSPINCRYFAVSGALYLLPFFLAGMYVKRFNISPRPSLGLALLVVVSIALFSISPDFHVSKYNRDAIVLLVGIATCISFISFGWKSAPLAFVGKFSYSIYIYHVFFTAASRIFLLKLGIDDLGLLITISLIIGLFGPMLFELVINKSSYGKTLFLGKRFDTHIPTAKVF